MNTTNTAAIAFGLIHAKIDRVLTASRITLGRRRELVNLREAFLLNTILGVKSELILTAGLSTSFVAETASGSFVEVGVQLTPMSSSQTLQQVMSGPFAEFGGWRGAASAEQIMWLIGCTGVAVGVCISEPIK